MAAQITLQYAFSPQDTPVQTFCYEVKNCSSKQVKGEKTGIYTTVLHLKNRITLEEADLAVAVGYTRHTFEVTCGVARTNDIQTEQVFAQLQTSAKQNEPEKFHAQITQQFKKIYSFVELFYDVRRAVLKQLLSKMEKETSSDFEKIFQRQYPAVRGLKYIGAPLPSAFTAVADFVLTDDLRAELERPEVDINALEELMEDVRSLGLTIDPRKILPVIQKRLLGYARNFAKNPQELGVAVQLVEFINYMEIFGFSPDYTQAQLLVFEGLQKLPADKRGKSILKALSRKLKIALE